MKPIVITNKGKELVAKLVEGTTTAKFKKFVTSTKDYTDFNISELNQLEDVKQEKEVSGIDRTNAYTILTYCTFDNKEINTGYYIKTLGLYAEDDNGNMILFGVCTSDDISDYMPPYGGATPYYLEYNIYVKVDNSEQIIIEVSSSAYATASQVTNLQSNVQTHTDTKINTESGVHGIRFHNDNLGYYDDKLQKWVDIESTDEEAVKQLIEDNTTNTTVVDSLDSISATSALSANQGNVLKKAIETAETNITNSKVTVINNLTSTATDSALSAYQGKLLKDEADYNCAKLVGGRSVTNESGTTYTGGTDATVCGYGNRASGSYSNASGYNNNASSTYTTAIGCNNTASNTYSIAIGRSTTASGTYSTSVGQSNTASGSYTTAVGRNNTATNSYAISVGHANTVSGSYSTGIGISNTLSGSYATILGRSNTASYNYAAAIGHSNTASNTYTLANGYNNKATGSYATALGSGNEAKGTSSLASGYNNTASSDGSAAIGNYNKTSNIHASAIGVGNTAGEDSSSAMGYYNEASGNCSSAVGYENTASGMYSVAFGHRNTASGSSATAIGNSNNIIANGIAVGADNIINATSTVQYSTAFGCNNIVDGYFSTALGIYNTIKVTNTYSAGALAVGCYNTIDTNANRAILLGNQNTATGSSTLLVGYGTTASGTTATAIGNYTTSNTFGCTVIGKYNSTTNGSATSQSTSSDAFVVGIGTSSTALKNGLRITGTGAVYGGTYSSSGADYAEYFEWFDGNEDEEERIGRFVTIKQGKIRIANADDTYIVGVISGNGSVVGDAQDDEWVGRFERDVYGRLICEWQDVEEVEKEFVENEDGEVEEVEKIVTKQAYLMKQNPKARQDEIYIPRSERSEWDIVGLMGKLIVIDDGTCEVDEFCSVGENGTATKGDKFMVLERLDETHIKILKI